MIAISIAFSAGLAYKYQELLPVFAEHLEDQSGEVLPHILFEEYSQFIFNREKSAEWIVSLLGYLESVYDYDDDPVSNVIALSFIESIPYSENQVHWARNLLGKKMEKHYISVFGHHKGSFFSKIRSSL